MLSRATQAKCSAQALLGYMGRRQVIQPILIESVQLDVVGIIISLIRHVVSLKVPRPNLRKTGV
jgi:hypothetical protein